MKRGLGENRNKRKHLDRSSDLRSWQGQTDAEKFAAAWQLVVDSYRASGKDVGELRLQRTVERMFRREG